MSEGVFHPTRQAWANVKNMWMFSYDKFISQAIYI